MSENESGNGETAIEQIVAAAGMAVDPSAVESIVVKTAGGNMEIKASALEGLTLAEPSVESVTESVREQWESIDDWGAFQRAAQEHDVKSGSWDERIDTLVEMGVSPLQGGEAEEAEEEEAEEEETPLPSEMDESALKSLREALEETPLHEIYEGRDLDTPDYKAAHGDCEAVDCEHGARSLSEPFCRHHCNAKNPFFVKGFNNKQNKQFRAFVALGEEENVDIYGEIA